LRHRARSHPRLPTRLRLSPRRSPLRRTAPAPTPSRHTAARRPPRPGSRAHPPAIAFTIAKFCAAQPAATDADVLAALQSQAESYKTLSAGIVYEQPPVPTIQRGLYDALAAFLNETKQSPAQDSQGRPKDSEIFQLLVFLYRMGLLRTNGRPRSRRFIEFLRGQFPGAHELKREESRIIVP
jgi:hypothetical protein